MRHIVSTLLCTLLFASFSPRAQAADRAGFLVGANLARLSTSDPDLDAGTDSNFLLGGFAEFELSPTFFIEPQVRYVEKGGDISAQDPTGVSDVSRTLKYFEIPLHFKWKFREGESLRPYAFVGPSLAFKIGDSTTITPRTTGVPVNATLPNDSVRTIDFAAEIGGGAEFFFTDEFSVNLGAAYSLGLLDVNETPANWKTRGLQLFAGLGFAY
jgi:opacity protein-like surface antigen